MPRRVNKRRVTGEEFVDYVFPDDVASGAAGAQGKAGLKLLEQAKKWREQQAQG